MKVFLTGGTGYIGTSIVLEVLNRGHELTLLARNPSKVPALLKMPGVSLVEGTLDDMELIRSSLKGHQACVHNAIYWEEEPTELEMKDTRASAMIFEAAGEAGVEQVIYTSSVAVHRPFTSRMNENARIQPADYYGATKAASEMFLSAASHQYPMRCNVVRPGPTIGVPALEGIAPNCHSYFAKFIKAARSGEDITVVEGDGRQFIFVSDLAKIYEALLASDLNRETFVGLAQNFTTWEQIAQEIVSAVRSASRVLVKQVNSDAEQPTFDVGKIERHFGFRFNTEPTLAPFIRYLVAAST